MRRRAQASLPAPFALAVSLCFWSDPLHIWEPVAALARLHRLRRVMPEFDGHKAIDQAGAAHQAGARVCTGPIRRRHDRSGVRGYDVKTW
ncbi:hypothetical protein B5V02_05750 [Mesorhizobium kowhaii]|uniref:Uncharacterized protein n=1 Tax=Mesorhizobium kowhaii TaxID=1300272 RepID=A0A2W7CB44_9HYPH|nr:hypothetical protein B5V02_05750 [Mesorhizobium kowhaii]